jgi:hypothetical protein
MQPLDSIAQKEIYAHCRAISNTQPNYIGLVAKARVVGQFEKTSLRG